MTLTLHVARGTVAMCVHAALEEAAANYTVAWVDFKAGAQAEAPFRALNPKGRVPVLIAGTEVLTEAPALLDYVAATHPGAGLMPTDPIQAARAREMISYLASSVHVSHAHKMRGHRWADDPAALESMRAKVPQTMTEHAAYLEERLEGDWVTHDFSVADLHLWNVTRWLPADGVDMQTFPKLQAHHDRVAARPAVARVIALHES